MGGRASNMAFMSEMPWRQGVVVGFCWVRGCRVLNSHHSEQQHEQTGRGGKEYSHGGRPVIAGCMLFPDIWPLGVIRRSPPPLPRPPPPKPPPPPRSPPPPGPYILTATASWVGLPLANARHKQENRPGHPLHHRLCLGEQLPPTSVPLRPPLPGLRATAVNSVGVRRGNRSRVDPSPKRETTRRGCSRERGESGLAATT